MSRILRSHTCRVRSFPQAVRVLQVHATTLLQSVLRCAPFNQEARKRKCIQLMPVGNQGCQHSTTQSMDAAPPNFYQANTTAVAVLLCQKSQCSAATSPVGFGATSATPVQHHFNKAQFAPSWHLSIKRVHRQPVADAECTTQARPTGASQPHHQQRPHAQDKHATGAAVATCNTSSADRPRCQTLPDACN